MNEHVFLTGIVVATENDRAAAELWLHRNLNMPAFRNNGGANEVDCWWIAEDDRRDGSDLESAVFIPGDAGTGMPQREARRILEDGPTPAIIRSAAVAFLMGEDSPFINLTDLAAALDIPVADVPALQHAARPADNPEGDAVCKDCGQPVFWVGPGMSEWAHADIGDDE